MTLKKLGIDAAYEALDGRLGCGDDNEGKAEKVLLACEEYVRAEDALPGDEFDSEDYLLSKAVEALVKQRDDERDELAALEEENLALRQRLDEARVASGEMRRGHVSEGLRRLHACLGEPEWKPYPPGMGEESRRLHREYNALVEAQRNGAKNGADVVRLTDECNAKGIILVPGGEYL